MKGSKEIKRIKKDIYENKELSKKLKKEIYNLHNEIKNENDNEKILFINKIIIMKSKEILLMKKQLDNLVNDYNLIVGYENLEKIKFKNEQKNKKKELKKRKGNF